jgi:putative Mg2+ transporter-C (MgtC) family protein
MDLAFGDFVLRLALALVTGSIIGAERQLNHHLAGLKTNALVATGAALFMMLATALNSTDGASRVAAQIISGIGFLGGGVILRDGLHVRGLNTAATLWCAAAVGTLAGLGLITQSVLGTVAVLIINVALKPLSKRLGEESINGDGTLRYSMSVVCRKDLEPALRASLLHAASEAKVDVCSLRTQVADAEDVSLTADFMCTDATRENLKSLMTGFEVQEGIRSIDWQQAKPQ